MSEPRCSRTSTVKRSAPASFIANAERKWWDTADAAGAQKCCRKPSLHLLRRQLIRAHGRIVEIARKEGACHEGRCCDARFRTDGHRLARTVRTGGDSNRTTAPSPSLSPTPTPTPTGQRTEWRVTQRFVSVVGPDNCWVREQRDRWTGAVFPDLPMTVTRSGNAIALESSFFQVNYSGSVSGNDFAASGGPLEGGGSRVETGRRFSRCPVHPI